MSFDFPLSHLDGLVCPGLVAVLLLVSLIVAVRRARRAEEGPWAALGAELGLTFYRLARVRGERPVQTEVLKGRRAPEVTIFTDALGGRWHTYVQAAFARPLRLGLTIVPDERIEKVLRS